MENRQDSSLVGATDRGFDADDKSGSLSVGVQSLDPREQFGQFLRDRRDAAQLSIESISRTTKIPKLSLEHLEAGRFEELPGDVFVRGFLRSYARCIGVDGDDLVDEYALCGLRPAPVSSDLADSLASTKRRRSAPKPRVETGRSESGRSESGRCSEDTAKIVQIWRTAFDGKKAAGRDAGESKTSSVKEAKSELAKADSVALDPGLDPRAAPEATKRIRTFVPPALGFEEDRGARRGALTLGVIVLVIVATVTMSFLLQRPGSSSDGFTMLEQSESLTTPLDVS